MGVRGVGTCIVLAAVYMTLIWTMTTVRIGNVGPLAANCLSIASVAILMLVQLAFAVSIVSLRMKVARSALAALVSAALFVGIILLMKGELRAPMAAVIALAGIQQLLLMAFAAFLGCTISFVVREPNILLPAMIFAALVDYWNVAVGPLVTIVEKKPAIVEAASVHMPSLVDGVPAMMMGLGDFVFLALFFGVLFRFSMNVTGAFWAGYGFLTVSMLAVMKLGGALPALVPMALAIAGTNARHFKLRREELLATVYVGVLLAAVLTVLGIFVFK